MGMYVKRGLLVGANYSLVNNKGTVRIKMGFKGVIKIKSFS